jgi:hypothetical protein
MIFKNFWELYQRYVVRKGSYSGLPVAWFTHLRLGGLLYILQKVSTNILVSNSIANYVYQNSIGERYEVRFHTLRLSFWLKCRQTEMRFKNIE